GAIMRVRSVLSFAVHKYFQDKGFVYVNTPIITGADAEGAGEMFQVTSLPLDNLPKNEEGNIDFKKDFFGKHTNLTVSGQLEGETFAMALGQIYTFGPTFRAENSNTSRHLAEFWMIEPEVAFNDLDDNMDLAEDFIQYVIKYALDNCGDDLKFLEGRLLEEEKSKPQADRSEMALLEKLNFVLENNFKRVSYTEAIDILRDSTPNKKKKFQYIINEWGADLQSEHERYLVEKHFKCPVILFDYPANIKAFYMRLNDNTEPGRETVRAMDILFPGIGEIVGGSEREERYDVLVEKMKALEIDEEELYWYLDTRRFGSATHAGFGLGFERLVLFVTGMTNIRDVIPFPRTPGSAEF
ncbi:MAG TPA: asparagine--tRNA ligase, partial [Flavobacterium sp.]